LSNVQNYKDSEDYREFISNAIKVMEKFNEQAVDKVHP